MSTPDGGNDITRGLPPFSCNVALTADSGHDYVRSGSDDSIEQSNSDKDELQPNSFGLDDEVDAERADQLGDDVAELWDTPTEEWWP